MIKKEGCRALAGMGRSQWPPAWNKERKGSPLTPNGQSAPCSPLLIVPRARKIHRRASTSRARRRIRASIRHQKAQRNKTGEKRFRLHHRWVKIQTPSMEASAAADTMPETLATHPPHDQVRRDDPADRRQRIGQAQRELIFAEQSSRDQHGPVDQRRFLHAWEAVAHRHEPVAAGVHLPHRAGVKSLVVVENHRGKRDADVKQRDQSQHQPRSASRGGRKSRIHGAQSSTDSCGGQLFSSPGKMS